MQKFVLQTFTNMSWSKKCTSQHRLPSSGMISRWFLPLRATIGYSLKARIVSTVRDIEDGSHFCCCVRLHLLKKGLQVGALPRNVKINFFLKHPWYCNMKIKSKIRCLPFRPRTWSQSWDLGCWWFELFRQTSISWIHVGDWLSQPVMFLGFDKDLSTLSTST